MDSGILKDEPIRTAKWAILKDPGGLGPGERLCLQGQGPALTSIPKSRSPPNPSTPPPAFTTQAGRVAVGRMMAVAEPRPAGPAQVLFLLSHLTVKRCSEKVLVDPHLAWYWTPGRGRGGFAPGLAVTGCYDL